MHYLYIITNVSTGKKYVGQTTDPIRRWITHTTLTNPVQYIDRAIRKNGISNFVYEIVAMCLTQMDANETEDVLIKQYNSRDKQFGYNIKPGGKVATGWFHTEETKKKISESESGKILSKDTKIKMSQAQKVRVRLPIEFEKMAATKKKKNSLRFSDEIILSIKSEYSDGNSIGLLAKKYKTRKSTISKIIRNVSLV
jgi:group I intron endonuclease